MVNCKSPYEPREDSTLLEKYVRQYAHGNVLDMGTGSGIQAITAAHIKNVNSVIATDIQKSTIEYCKKNIKNKKIKFIASDLFGALYNNRNPKKFDTLENSNNRNFRRAQKPLVFDTIIFNPPYLPEELKVKDLTIEGGKKGYEVIENFLNDVNNYLKPDGLILILFSSLTKKEKVDEYIRNNLIEFKLLEKQHYFFEDLFVYKINKSAILKELENEKLKNIKFFSKGKRGLIFTGYYKKKKVAIKIKNPDSDALLRIENEITYIKLLNKKNIGPKLIFYGKDFLVYEFLEGYNILDFLDTIKKDSIIEKYNKKEKNNNKINKNYNNLQNKKIIIKIIKKIMVQMHIMDKLKINKEEMSHPQNHIIIDKKNNPILLDFERTRYTLKPSNVTQFTDFLISKNILKILKNNRIIINKNIMINAARKYKNQENKDNFIKILKLIEDG